MGHLLIGPLPFKVIFLNATDSIGLLGISLQSKFCSMIPGPETESHIYFGGVVDGCCDVLGTLKTGKYLD